MTCQDYDNPSVLALEPQRTNVDRRRTAKRRSGNVVRIGRGAEWVSSKIDINSERPDTGEVNNTQ